MTHGNNSPETPPAAIRMMQRLMPIIVPFHVWIYRVMKGRFVDKGFGGALPVMLLTTTGRRSGQPRTVAIGHMRDGADVIVVGTNAGLPALPYWLHNLRENPQANVQIGNERFPVRAEWIEGEEREKIWNDLVSSRPIYGEVKRYAGREIPVIRLRRVESSAD